jgi:hypothetical protein
LWVTTPPVDEVRPAHCPRCNAASRPLGAGVVLHGHGLRERQLWGPLEPDGEPRLLVVKVRRYLCTACGTAVTVGPSETLPGRLYTASAIALALALYGLRRMATSAVRALVSPTRVVGATSAVRWLTLKRWCRVVGTSALFRRVRRVEGGPRRGAAEAAASLAAHALPSLEPPPMHVQAFVGAARAG